MIGTIVVCVSLRWTAAAIEKPPYDPASVETVRGAVVRVVRIAHPTGIGVHLVRRTDAGEDVPVALGPARFVERAFPIRPGDGVEITSARVVPGKPTFVASEVRKGNQVLRLRDRYGVPLWQHGAARRSTGTAQ
jgi:hypothetical protein